MKDERVVQTQISDILQQLSLLPIRMFLFTVLFPYCSFAYTTPTVSQQVFSNIGMSINTMCFQWQWTQQTFAATAVTAVNVFTSFAKTLFTFPNAVKKMSMNAVSFTSILCLQTIATNHIFMWCNRFNMNRIDANPSATKMIAFKFRGNFVNKNLINQAVGSRCVSIVFKRPVAVIRAACKPIPTRFALVKMLSGYANFRKDSGEKFSVNGKSDKLTSGHIISLITNNVSRLVREVTTLSRAVFSLRYCEVKT